VRLCVACQGVGAAPPEVARRTEARGSEIVVVDMRRPAAAEAAGVVAPLSGS
jgi:hypothetical protein